MGRALALALHWRVVVALVVPVSAAAVAIHGVPHGGGAPAGLRARGKAPRKPEFFCACEDARRGVSQMQWLVPCLNWLGGVQCAFFMVVSWQARAWCSPCCDARGGPCGRQGRAMHTSSARGATPTRSAAGQMNLNGSTRFPLNSKISSQRLAIQQHAYKTPKTLHHKTVLQCYDFPRHDKPIGENNLSNTYSVHLLKYSNIF